ncbi:MAG: hypothetical protein K2X39_09535 [Silvanigrellaceae bacterium]|nr:hypothetical protein [Silvanigrellaceae bacterium]
MKEQQKISSEELEKIADRGEDTSKYFGTPVAYSGIQELPKRRSRCIQKVNVDLSEGMLHDLDSICEELNVTGNL